MGEYTMERGTGTAWRESLPGWLTPVFAPLVALHLALRLLAVELGAAVPLRLCRRGHRFAYSLVDFLQIWLFHLHSLLLDYTILVSRSLAGGAPWKTTTRGTPIFEVARVRYANGWSARYDAPPCRALRFSLSFFSVPLGDRLAVGHWTLAPGTRVRILLPQPNTQ